jgi:hypothetical protein
VCFLLVATVSKKFLIIYSWIWIYHMLWSFKTCLMFIEDLNIFLTKLQRKTKLAFGLMGWPHGLAHMAWSDPVGLGPVRTRPDHGPPDALPLLLSHPLSLSSPENAAASPPSPGRSQPSLAPARWCSSPPRRALPLPLLRFDPLFLNRSPMTPEP